MVTFAAVGATPCPVHDNTAVIVTGVSAANSSLDGLTFVTSIVVAIPPVTTWFTEPEAAVWLLSPAYDAETVSVPTGRCDADEVVQVATPGYAPDNVLAAHPVFALQVTVPVGCIGRIPFLPGFRPFTSPVSVVIVAVNVTDPPYVDGFRPEVTVVVEFAPVRVKLPVSGLVDAE
jgi:hypothetical protein